MAGSSRRSLHDRAGPYADDHLPGASKQIQRDIELEYTKSVSNRLVSLAERQADASDSLWVAITLFVYRKSDVGGGAAGIRPPFPSIVEHVLVSEPPELHTLWSFVGLRAV